MITLVRKAVGYILNNGENAETEDKVDERPRLEDFISLESDNSESKEFEGIVSFVNGNNIVINKDIYFEVPPQKCPKPFSVGDRVNGIAHRKMEVEAWRASFVQHQREAWDSIENGMHDSAETHGSTNRSRKGPGIISCRDLEAGIPGIFKQDLLSSKLKNMKMKETSSCVANGEDSTPEKTSEHSAIGKVTAIYGDSITVNETLHFTFSSTGCSFQLMKGDWIIYKVESNSCKDESASRASQADLPRVSSIEPLRKKRIRGVVSWRYSSHVIINEEVFVPKCLPLSSSLHVGDSVTVDVIESEQEIFCWRAIDISITPAVKSNPPSNKDRNLTSADGSSGLIVSGENKISHLLKDKNGIIISKVVKFPVVYLGITSYTAAFIKNIGAENQSLRRVYFVSTSDNCQFTLDSSSAGEINNTSIALQADTGISIRFKCEATLLGLAKHLCIFDFGDFQIGRYITAMVEDEQMSSLLPSSPVSFHQSHKKRKDCQPMKGMVIPGTSPFRPPPFLPVNLPAALVPNYLWQLVQNNENALDVIPYLGAPLTRENHNEKLSVLLHLEEIAMEQQMRQFDMARSTLSKHGEYLSLTVPGLAEKRPSLMVGDTILVSTPDSAEDIFYEGYIHEVLHTQVLLKFHPTFHQQYQGEDYAIQFKFNRTPLRRCHFALGFSMTQLGPEILFPSKLKLQLPQVSYVDPEVPTSIYQGRRKRSLAQVERDPSPLKSKLPNQVANGKTGHKPCIGATQAEGESSQGIHSNRNSSYVSCRKDASAENNEDPHPDADPDVVIETDDEEEEESVLREDSPSLSGERRTESLDTKDALNSHGTFLHKSFRNGGRQIDDTIHENSIPEELQQRLLKIKEGAATPEPKHMPPRIPVVTRLFGVPSPSSSSNSSKSFSDDEMRDIGEGRRNRRRFMRVENTQCLFRNFPDAQTWSMDRNNAKDPHSTSQERPVELSKDSIWYEQEPHEVSYISSQQENGAEIEEYAKGQSNSSEKLRVNQKLLLKGLESSKRNSERRQKKKSQKVDNIAAGERGHTGKQIHNAKQHNSCTGQREYRYPGKGRLSAAQSADGGKENKYYIPVIPVDSLNKKGREALANIPTLKWINIELNAEQKLAVRRILEGSTRPLPYVIFGPPGTGKTVTLVEAALQVLKMVKHSRLLIVTPSNSASDLVTEKLLASGHIGKADLVRLNPFHRQEENVPKFIRPHCCKGDDLRLRVHQRIIVTTASTSGLLYTLGLHNGHFSHVFVDEAGQLTEPECLLSVGLVNKVSGQIVMAGDPEQLGPVVQSNLAKKYGLRNSFLHRLCSSVLYQAQEEGSLSWVYEPHLVTQLVRNYRSHLDIIAVPSKLFYHESLQAFAKQEKQQELLGWSELPNPSSPLLFHGLVSDNLQEGDSPSWFNPAEAFQVVRYAKSLTEFSLNAQDIGIITPYRKQVDKIRLLLTTFGVAEGIKVGSVEEFQGQERKAIIVSTVRSSLELVEIDLQHSLGFVKCRRRFNVAVTRAQSLLVIVGNPLLLSQDEYWRELITFCISKGVYRGPDLDFLFQQS